MTQPTRIASPATPRTRRRGLLRLALSAALLCAAAPAAAQDLEWVRSPLEPSSGRAVVSDAAGNAYLIGDFGDSITLGAGEPGEITLRSSSGFGSFLAKYGPGGALDWAIETAGFRAFALALGPDGGLYLTGLLNGTLTVGEGAYRTEVTGDEAGDALLAKYDRSGMLLWARTAAGPESEFGLDVAVDASGLVQITGSFSTAITFGAGEETQTELSAPTEQRGGFLAAYAADGDLVRAQGIPAHATDLAVDGAGNTYVTGSFSGSVDFALGPHDSVNLTSAGNSDVFFARYDAGGQLRWARSDGGPNSDSPFDIAVDGSGNLYLSGIFERFATFGAGQPNEVHFDSPGVYSSFFSSYSTEAASLRWVHTTGGDGKLAGVGLAVDAEDHVYMVGQFLGQVILGEGELNETELLSLNASYPGPDDIFSAKFSPAGTLVWARSAPGPQELDRADAVAIDPGEGMYVTGTFHGTVTFGPGEANQTVLTRSEETLYLARYHRGPATGEDRDGDGVPDAADNCTRLANPEQTDDDGNGFGDACVPVGSVHRRARIGADPLIGFGSYVARGAELGERPTLGGDVAIERDVRAGSQLRVGDGSRIERGAQLGDHVQLGTASVIERGARIGSHVRIGDGVVIGANAYIEDGAWIGSDTWLGARARIGAQAQITGGSTRLGPDLRLGEHAFIGTRAQFERAVVVGPGALVGASVRAGRGAAIGASALLGEGVELGRFATVAVGAVVPDFTHIPPHAAFP